MSDFIAANDGLSDLDTDASLHFGSCGCPGCMAAKDDTERNDPDTAFTGTSQAETATLGEMAEFLETGYWSGTTGRRHNVGTTGFDANNGVLLYNVSGYGSDANGLTSARAELVRDAFDLFEATLGIDFQETSSTDTNTVDFFFSDNQSGAYAGGSTYSDGTIRYSYINVAQSWSGSTSTFDDYTFQTILHEIGHALGLGHQGQYNGSASYANDAIYELDSWQASMMSYFSQTENSAINANYELLQTPMAVDWIALDRIYGQFGYGTDNAFTGDTVYGFNTNISANESKVWNEYSTYARRTASTIVDGDGIDTVDFSGYSNTQKIDLTIQTEDQESQNTSNIGGRTGNLTLAIGTIIENAIGGSGQDTIIGNSADNILRGGSGNDTLTGAMGNDMLHGDAGTDTAVFSFALSSYAFSLFEGALEVVGEGIDVVFDTIENLQFSDGIRSFASLFQSTSNNKPLTQNDNYNLDEGENRTLSVLSNDSDADNDALTIIEINGISVSANSTLALPSGATIKLNSNGTLSFDQNGAYDSLNAGQTGQETITYTVSDGETTSTASITISIAGNSAPTTRNDSFALRAGQDAALDVLDNDFDSDNDTLTITAINGTEISRGGSVTLSSGARVTLNNAGTLSYDQLGAFAALAAGQTDTEIFSYTVTDGLTPSTSTATVTITGNIRPTGRDDDFRVGEGNIVELDVLANDSDGNSDPLSVTQINGAAISVGGTVTLGSGARVSLTNDGNLIYDQRGVFDSLDNWDDATESFDYTLSDGIASATASVDISIDGYEKPDGDYRDWFVGADDAEWLAGSVVKNVKVYGADGADNLLGTSTAGGDALAGGDGRDWLWGMDGDDILLGNIGDDRLFGGNGSDALFGGSGNDRLIGGAGADRFVFEDNNDADVILDFENGLDQIVIDINGYADFDDLSSKMIQQGNDVAISFGVGDNLRILDTTLAELDHDSFVFV